MLRRRRHLRQAAGRIRPPHRLVVAAVLLPTVVAGSAGIAGPASGAGVRAATSTVATAAGSTVAAGTITTTHPRAASPRRAQAGTSALLGPHASAVHRSTERGARAATVAEAQLHAAATSRPSTSPGPSLAGTATAATPLVNVATDLPLASGMTRCDTDTSTSGLQCSLRAALQLVQTAGSGTITFASALTITTTSALPVVSVPTIIDGSTVPGYGASTRVTLRRSPSAPVTHGLVLGGPGSTVRGLTVSGFTGVVSDAGYTHESAAGVLLHNDSSQVVDCVLTGNQLGVWVDAGAGTTIGGTAPHQPDVFSGNLEAGVVLSSRHVTDATVAGNTVDSTTGTGILVSGASVASAVDGPARSTISGNVVTGTSAPAPGVTNRGDGSGIAVLAGDETTVVGNRVGLTAAGDARGNVYGVTVSHATDTSVGTLRVGDGNVVSGNTTYGIGVIGDDAVGTQVAANVVGLDPTGSAGRPNGVGIVLTSAGPDVPGPSFTVLTSDTVGANTSDGLQVTTASDTTVSDLVVGSDPGGTATTLGNHGDGVRLDSVDTVDVHGLQSVENVGSGVVVTGTAHTPSHGVSITASALGTTRDGSLDLGNSHAGLAVLDGTTGVVLGPGSGATAPPTGTLCDDCNRIDDNHGSGVQVQDDPSDSRPARGVSIRGNEIRDNALLGVDLIAHAPGLPVPEAVTANDAASKDGSIRPDADSGGNDLLNAPIGVMKVQRPVAGYEGTHGETAVSGVATTDHPEQTVVDVYGSAATDRALDDGPASYGQGSVWLGSTTPRSDGSFDVVVPAALTARAEVVSAVSTDASGSSSEFSATCMPLTAGASPDADADGLCDQWETGAHDDGIDADRDGTADLNLPALGASPTQRDLFVENDRINTPEAALPTTRAMQDVVAAFAAAPGGGIALHLASTPGRTGGDIVDDELPTSATVDGITDDDTKLVGASLQRLRDGDPVKPCDGAFGTAADRALTSGQACAARIQARRLAYRWALWGSQFAVGNGASGVAEDGGNTFLVTFGAWTDDQVKHKANVATCGADARICRSQLGAATFMHELGHTLGLGHGGGDSANLKPNYLSIMNYAFQFPVIYPNRPLDYSRVTFPSLDKTHLVESQGLTQGNPWPSEETAWDTTVTMKRTTATSTTPSTCTTVAVPARGGIDWDSSGGAPSTTAEQWNVNASATEKNSLDPGSCAYDLAGLAAFTPPLTGFTDWSALDFDQRWSETSWDDFLDELTPAPPPPGPAAHLPPPDSATTTATPSRRSTTADDASSGIDELTQDQAAALAAANDTDGDGVTNDVDDCPTVADADQTDSDHDGLGDACLGQVTARDVRVSAPPAVAASVGATVTVPITLSDDYPLPATGLTVAVTLPASLKLVKVTSATGTVAPASPTPGSPQLWTVPSLPGRGGAILTVKAKVLSPDAAGLVAELLTADQPDPTSVPGDHAAWQDDESTTTVTGTPVPGVTPVVEAPTPLTARQGTAWSATASFTDSDSAAWTATVDSGDGRGPRPASVASATHKVTVTATFAGSGPLPVTVCVTDVGGLRGCRTSTVTVTATVPTTPVAVDLGATAPAPVAVTTAPGQTLRFTRSDGSTTAVSSGDGTLSSGTWGPAAAYAAAPSGPAAISYGRAGRVGEGVVVSACPTADGLDATETGFLDALNAYRISIGAPPVSLSRTATAAALREARDIAATGVPSHEGSDGSTPQVRMLEAGYTASPVAENVLRDASADTGAGALAQWQSSPPHDATMRDPRWRTLGIARVEAPDGTASWSTTFGPVDDCSVTGGVSPALVTSPTVVATGGSTTVVNRSTAQGTPTRATVRAGDPAATFALGKGASKVVTYGTAGVATVTGTVAGATVRTAVTVGTSATLTYGGPTTVTTGSTFVASATLTRSDTGAPVSSATVTVGWLGTTTTATTDSAGRAEVALVAPSTTGSQSLTLSSAAVGDLLPATAAATLTVTSPQPTTVTYTGATSVQAGGQLAARARVTTAATGDAVPGATVSFTLGSSVAHGTTGADGTATASLTAPTAAGSSTLQVDAAATQTTAASSTTATITVTAAPTVSVVYTGPRWIVTQRPSTLSAVVTDARTHATLSGQTVRFALGRRSATAVTGADGVASAILTPASSPIGATTLGVDVLSGDTPTASGPTAVTVLAPGVASVVAGLGSGPFATAGSQFDVAGLTGRAGVVYLADRISNAVLEVDTVGSPTVATVVVPASALGPFPYTSDAFNKTPVGLALDGAGRLLVADPGRNRVLRWDPASGLTTVVAGTGAPGFSGDGGAATAATLSAPSGVAVDADGRILVADTGNSRVRVVSTTGVISTVLGAGAPGTAGTATLTAPVSVTVPTGDVVAVLDLGGSQKVDELSTSGTVTTTMDGRYSFRIRGITTDSTGALLISRDNDVTRWTGGASTTVLSTSLGSGTSDRPGEGAAPGGGLGSIQALGYDGSTLLFVQVARWSIAREITGFGTSGAVVRTVAGSSPIGFTGQPGAAATSVLLGEPAGVAVDRSGTTYVLDPKAYRLFAVPTSGTISSIGGDTGSQAVVCGNSSNSGVLSLSHYFCEPSDLATGPNGALLLLDSGHGQVFLAQPGSGAMTLVAGNEQTTQNTQEGQQAVYASLQGAQGAAIDPTGNVVVTDTSRHRMRRVAGGVVNTFVGTGAAGFSGDGGAASAAQLSSPSDATYDSAGNLYIADTGNNRIRRVAAGTGVITTVAGSGAAGFSGDGGPATSAALNGPTDVLPVGTTTLLVADRANHRIRMVDLTTGTITTVAGSGSTTATPGATTATTMAIPWPTKLGTDAGGTVLVGSQRGGSYDGSGWNPGSQSGAVIRFSLPAGR